MTETRRAGLREVAARAGVGTATVDRVLNERGGVRVDTARRVIEAARALGLRRTLPPPYARKTRLDVLLARLETPFCLRLQHAFPQLTCAPAPQTRHIKIKETRRAPVLPHRPPTRCSRHLLPLIALLLVLHRIRVREVQPNQLLKPPLEPRTLDAPVVPLRAPDFDELVCARTVDPFGLEAGVVGRGCARDGARG